MQLDIQYFIDLVLIIKSEWG